MMQIENIKDIVEEACKNSGIHEVVLVGSYAKGNQTQESDIDVVLMDEDICDEYFDFCDYIEKNSSYKWDVLTIGGVSNSILKDDILQGGIVIYAQ